MPSLLGDDPLAPGTTLLVETVQRAVFPRFMSVDKRMRRPGTLLLRNAIKSNYSQTAACEYHMAESLNLTSITNGIQSRHKKEASIKAGPKTRIIARLPNLIDAEKFCVRLRYSSDQDIDIEGVIFLEVEESGFRPGFGFQVTPTLIDNIREFSIILPKKMNGRKIRFDPRLKNGEISNFAIEVGKINAISSTKE